jgi:hypothetical protein
MPMERYCTSRCEERRAQPCACAHEWAEEFGVDLAHTLI